ncbi:MAG: UPF0280 family protein [Bacillota bacterium]
MTRQVTSDGNKYMKRIYRQSFDGDLQMVTVAVKETDLAICLPAGIWTPQLAKQAVTLIKDLRQQLELYLSTDPEFLVSHQPCEVKPHAPPIALAMSQAARQANVGPMATVAGVFSQAMGQFLSDYSSEVIVENGGDIYLQSTQERLVGIFAGTSPFNEKLALRVRSAQCPVGICTSSGMVGHSFSYGKADAAVIIASDTLLADAVATATANLVQTAADVAKAAEFAMQIKNIIAAVVIKDEKIAAAGDTELVPL